MYWCSTCDATHPDRHEVWCARVRERIAQLRRDDEVRIQHAVDAAEKAEKAVALLQSHWDRFQRAFFDDDEPDFGERVEFRQHINTSPVWHRTFHFLKSIDPARVRLAMPD